MKILTDDFEDSVQTLNLNDEVPDMDKEPEVDYPAAHSVDTMWFAVDKDGHIGIFDSGEDGPIPAVFDNDRDGICGLTPEMLLEKMESVRGQKRDQFDMYKGEELGFYTYDPQMDEVYELQQQFDPDESKTEFPAPMYARLAVPSEPITIADLPSEWHEAIEIMRLPGVSFSNSKLFQPGEHFASVGWGTDCYLGLDGQSHKFTTPDPELIKKVRVRKYTAGGAKQDKPWWQRLFGL